jgi:hypothetical protein
LLELARAVAGKIQGTSRRAHLVAELPQIRLLNTSIRCFKGDLGFMNNYASLGKEAFRFQERVMGDFRANWHGPLSWGATERSESSAVGTPRSACRRLGVEEPPRPSFLVGLTRSNTASVAQPGAEQDRQIRRKAQSLYPANAAGTTGKTISIDPSLSGLRETLIADSIMGVRLLLNPGTV